MAGEVFAAGGNRQRLLQCGETDARSLHSAGFVSFGSIPFATCSPCFSNSRVTEASTEGLKVKITFERSTKGFLPRPETKVPIRSRSKNASFIQAVINKTIVRKFHILVRPVYLFRIMKWPSPFVLATACRLTRVCNPFVHLLCSFHLSAPPSRPIFDDPSQSVSLVATFNLQFPFVPLFLPRNFIYFLAYRPNRSLEKSAIRHKVDAAVNEDGTRQGESRCSPGRAAA